MKRTRLAPIIFVLKLSVVASLSAQDTARFKVVVNLENPTASLSEAEISLLFLKKEDRWKNGWVIAPIEQSGELQEEFVERIHNKKVSEIRNYWNRMIFSGRAVPPPQVSSDEAVIQHVSRNRGGIGYVSARANTAAVKVIEITSP